MTVRPSYIKTTLTSLVALSALMPMSACDLAQNQLKMDRASNSEMQDFRDAMAPREAQAPAAGADSVPELQPYVSDATKSTKPMPLVSISINQSIPLREALFELAKQANYDIELDPRISGSIIFTARNRPFDVVIDKVCEIAGLRYKIQDNSIRVELDTPYTQNYKVDYLALVRKNKSGVSTTASVATGGGAAGGTGGSTFSVDSTADSDFWGELDTNLKQILSSNTSGSYLKTDEDPTISLTATSPVNPPVPPIDESALKDGVKSGTAAASVAPKAGAEVSSPVSVPATTAATPATTTSGTVLPPGTAVTPATATPATTTPAAATPAANTTAPATTTTPAATAPTPGQVGEQPATPKPNETVLKVESLPTAASGAGGQNANRNAVEFTPAYSINKQAGIVSVYANERVQKKVADYLNQLQRATSSQVLIEAKVLEVNLNDEFATGINWTQLGTLGDFKMNFNMPLPSFSPASSSTFSAGFAGTDINTFVKALSRFGTVHALASPRLTVLNNQSAVLNVAENRVYFEVKISSTTTASTPPTNNVDVTSTVHTVPEGVLINVIPSIDLDKNTVSMQVRPTITRISEYVADPAVAFAAAQAGASGITSNIPVVSVQEVDSVVKIKSGEMMVIGGLLEDRSSSSRDAVPILGETPVVGSLFRNHNDKVNKTELVVFLKSTILNDPADTVSSADKDLYRVFGQDRRPHKF